MLCFLDLKYLKENKFMFIFKHHKTNGLHLFKK